MMLWIRVVLAVLFPCRHPAKDLRVDGIWSVDFFPEPMACVSCMRCHQSRTAPLRSDFAAAIRGGSLLRGRESMANDTAPSAPHVIPQIADRGCSSASFRSAS